MARVNLICQVYTAIIAGHQRYKGVVTDGEVVLYESKWRRNKGDAVADAQSNAARIDREMRKHVIH